MLDPKPTDPTPPSPDHGEGNPPNAADAPAPAAPTLTPEQEMLVALLAMGIEYGDTFTLRQAAASFNQSRRDVIHDGRVVLAADKQHIAPTTAWFERHAGEFKLRKASFYDQLKLKARVAALTEGQPVDEMTRSICEGTAVAELLLTSVPKWFDIASIDDNAVILLILHWHLAWEDRFRSAG